MKYDVLMIDDEVQYFELVNEYLQSKNADITLRYANSAESFNKEMQKKLPNLILMDWSIGADCGLALTKQVKGNPATVAIPLIMLTGKQDLDDQITGISEGADDYVLKPFDLKFLETKIHALLRKYEYNSLINQSFQNNFHFDENTLHVSIKGHAYNVRRKELLIIKHLVSNPSKVFSQEELNDLTTGKDVHVSRRSIDTFVNNIRKAISGDLITTIRGKGYKINEDYLK